MGRYVGNLYSEYYFKCEGINLFDECNLDKYRTNKDGALCTLEFILIHSKRLFSTKPLNDGVQGEATPGWIELFYGKRTKIPGFY